MWTAAAQGGWVFPSTPSGVSDDDVRLGTTNGGSTGTLAVPDPKYVKRGVATDDTVGTMPVIEPE